jgi:5-methylcytosine-specific restriction protein A
MPVRPKSHRVHRAETPKHELPEKTWGSDRGGRPWRRKRDAIMKRDNYLCQSCLRVNRVTEAKEVDHISNLAQGGTDDPGNLEAICVPCHKVKTASEACRGHSR